MFRAAFVSRSCTDPHEQHVHSLIPRPALPFGLLAGMIPQHEHVWVENASLTSSNTTHRPMALYLSCVRNVVHAASCTDFAMLVFAIGIEPDAPAGVRGLPSLAEAAGRAVVAVLFRIVLWRCAYRRFEAIH